MESFHAKSRALRKYCDDLRQAIEAGGVGIRFVLYRDGLITQEVREERAAKRIVSAIENKLASDESFWDDLIGVLRECEFHALAGNLEARLGEERRWEKRNSRVSVWTEESSARKFSYQGQALHDPTYA